MQKGGRLVFITNKSKVDIIIWLLLVVPCAVFFSSFMAERYYGTDFPVYYVTANRVLNPQIPIEEVYQAPILGANLPEKNLQGNNFIYSPLIAYLLSPLGFLEYYT